MLGRGFLVLTLLIMSKENRSPNDKRQKIPLYLDAVKLLERLSQMEPHIQRSYKFTLGRLMLDWAAQLVYKIDLMNMRRDKLAALEDIAATLRTVESVFYILIRCRALPRESPINEDAAALLFESIERQTRALWRASRNQNSHATAGQP